MAANSHGSACLKWLFYDSRVNPADKNHRALILATCNNRINNVKLLISEYQEREIPFPEDLIRTLRAIANGEDYYLDEDIFGKMVDSQHYKGSRKPELITLFEETFSRSITLKSDDNEVSISNGEFHRTDDAAFKFGKVQIWFQKGKIYREDGPAIIGKIAEIWLINNQLHRTDGPALVFKSGLELWFQNGILHRENGPAIKDFNINEFWFKEGKLHNDTTVAVLFRNSFASWQGFIYENGVLIPWTTKALKVMNSLLGQVGAATGGAITGYCEPVLG